MSDSSCNSFKDSGPKVDMIIINDKMKWKAMLEIRFGVHSRLLIKSKWSDSFLHGKQLC